MPSWSSTKLAESCLSCSAAKERSKRISTCARCGLGELDIADQRDLFQYVLGRVALVEAAVDDGQGQTIAMPEEDQRRHGEEFVQFPGDTGQGRTGVVCGPSVPRPGRGTFDGRTVPSALAREEHLLTAGRAEFPRR